MVLAVAHRPLVYHFLSLFAVSHQFSQRPSCHLSFFSLSSSFSPLLFHPLTHRSPRPRSETPLPSALLSLLVFTHTHTVLVKFFSTADDRQTK